MSVWHLHVRIFDAVTADELHKKIDEYISKKLSAKTWYDAKISDIKRF